MKKFLLSIKTNWWAAFLIMFSLLSLIAEISSGRWTMLDFQVYYRTAERMLAGAEIFRIAADDYFIYKYAPAAGIFFIPFTFLPLWLAKAIFWIGTTLVLGITLQKLFDQINKEGSSTSQLFRFTIFFALLTILIHVHSELTLGQVNLILLSLFVFVLIALREDKQIIAALLLACSLVVKPFGLIFIPYLILKKKYKSLFYFAGFSLLLILLPIFFYPSIDSFLALNKAWINELVIEMGNKQSLFAIANHTVFSVLARFTPIGLLLKSIISQKIYQILVVVLIAWLFYRLERRKQSLAMEVSILIILIPLFAATSKNAYIFAMPLAMYLISHFKDNSTLVKILTILGCTLIGGNIYELYGPGFSMFLTEISIYAIGSLFLLTAVFILSKQLQQKAQQGSKSRS